MISTPTLILREIVHRRKTSSLLIGLVAVMIGAVTFFSVNRAGYEKEMTRNARDIGSNVVILPSAVDQVAYHLQGGYSEETMNEAVLEQLLEHRASLNHLIPMLEEPTEIGFNQNRSAARLVGLSASVPMPGRPKSPMQRAIAKEQVQLGSQVAEALGIQRDEPAQVTIAGRSLSVARVNRSNGTWQDAAVLVDLELAQSLLDKPNQLSRIEAIECTSEECARTGLDSDVVLSNELARITDQAVLLRRDQMADARFNIRSLNRANLSIIQNSLWIMLALAIVAMTCWNTLQRRNETGVLQAIGYGPARLMLLLVGRSVILTLIGAFLGGLAGAFVSYSLSIQAFQATGSKFAIDWYQPLTILGVAVLLAALTACFPALFSATRLPADSIGKEN